MRVITSVISHDIRTPIMSLDSIIEFLEDENLPKEERREILIRMKESTRGISNLVHDMLNWINLSNGKVILTPLEVDIVEELRLYTNECIRFCPINKDIHITFHSSLESLHANVDMKILRTIYRNIITNAFKYLPKHGEVKCCISEIHDKVVIEIKDNGCGMSAKQVALLTRENRTVRYIETLDQGVGIGLQICTYFVDLMNGELKINSQKDIGTTFTIILNKNNGQ
ncbi:HAMP domain-containing sensor histidine kinase [Prolixibacteraceae bacterium]|nr:HAMP domain-containing sensor histidine kinase [Prolixibacteraceae bacterium]